MASSSNPCSRDLYECCLCLSKSKNVVTLSCGHSCCRSCTDGLTRKYGCTGSYSCPRCQQTFFTELDQDRPVYKLKKTALHMQTTADITTRPEDVACDTCTDSRQKAVKSCLVCLASYCATHLRLHNDLHVRASHTLVDATDQLQGKTCAVHGKVLEVYCHEKKQHICSMCMLEDYNGHNMVAEGQVEKVK